MARSCSRHRLRVARCRLPPRRIICVSRIGRRRGHGLKWGTSGSSARCLHREQGRSGCRLRSSRRQCGPDSVAVRLGARAGQRVVRDGGGSASRRARRGGREARAEPQGTFRSSGRIRRPTVVGGVLGVRRLRSSSSGRHRLLLHGAVRQRHLIDPRQRRAAGRPAVVGIRAVGIAAVTVKPACC